MKYVLENLEKLLKEADEAFEADSQIHWGAGWVNVLTGEVVPVPSMNHVQAILARPEYSTQQARYDDIEEDRSDTQQAFVDSYDPGEHIGWHAWSDNEWDLKKEKVMLSVMADGWVRYGYWIGITRRITRNEVQTRRTFEVSGLTQHLAEDQWLRLARRHNLTFNRYVKGSDNVY